MCQVDIKFALFLNKLEHCTSNSRKWRSRCTIISSKTRGIFVFLPRAFPVGRLLPHKVPLDSKTCWVGTCHGGALPHKPFWGGGGGPGMFWSFYSPGIFSSFSNPKGILRSKTCSADFLPLGIFLPRVILRL